MKVLNVKKAVSILCAMFVILAFSCVSPVFSAAAEEDIWLYIGSSHVKDYTLTDYADGTDALQAAFDDIASGSVKGDININRDIELTKQVKYSGSGWVSLHNEYTLTYLSSAKGESAAVNMNGGGLILKGKSGGYCANANFVSHGGNAFFENLKLQGKNYISGDLSVKDCAQIQINGWNDWNISGNFLISGNAGAGESKYDNFPICDWSEPNYYAGFVTIGGNFDYSDVISNRDNVAKFVNGAMLNGKYPVSVGGKIIAVKTTDIIRTVTGASIRLKNDYNGIRFYSVFDEQKADEAGVTSAGTIIAPKNLITGEFTKNMGEENFIDVKYNLSEGLFDKKYVVGSIVNIRKENIGREFVARGYVEIDGVTYYSETTSLDLSDNSGRSLQNVAQKAYDDKAYYNSLTAEQKAMIDSWRAGNPYEPA